MNQPTGEEPTGLIKMLLTRLTPKVLSILLALVLISMTVVLSLAVYRGSAVELWGIKISGRSIPENHAPDDNAPQDSTLSLASINEILGVSEGSKQQALTQIRRIVQDAKELEQWGKKFTFRLFRLELEITRFGAFIATNLLADDRMEAYRLIQSVLQEISFYQGALDGEQRATYNALVFFQQQYNERLSPDIPKLEPLGSFGYRTLEAIRSQYRQMNP